MKKLIFDELNDIALEVKNEIFPEINEDNEWKSALFETILILVARFMEVYQERISK